MNSGTPPLDTCARRRRRALIIGVLAAQVLVPAYLQLFGTEPPVRFAWQMYSSVRTWPEVDMVRTDGGVSSFTLEDIGTNRKELRPDADLLRRVCRSDPGIAGFRVRDGETTTTHRCP